MAAGIAVVRSWRACARKNVTGFISAGPTIFWNVEKK